MTRRDILRYAHEKAVSFWFGRWIVVATVLAIPSFALWPGGQASAKTPASPSATTAASPPAKASARPSAKASEDPPATASARPSAKTPLSLTTVVVTDPDFPPLDDALVKRALGYAAHEFELRFGVPAPRFDQKRPMSAQAFIANYGDASDPKCRSQYERRYRGGGKDDVTPFRDEAMRFLERWSVEELVGFLPEPERKKAATHREIYEAAVAHYVRTVAEIETLKTPRGTPLVSPRTSTDRSFVAWTCALLRQSDFDVVITNTFILADLVSEPHPHAFFGKAKIGGIATRSPQRSALDGQALLATTFGIDTDLPLLRELPDGPRAPDERARILGAYLLAHEIAHAVFGIPDVFDHPPGCLMTTRPGASYRDGLIELEEHPTTCPRCQPYVEARDLYDRGLENLRRGDAVQASNLLVRAARATPKHFHGGQKGRLSRIFVLASEAYELRKLHDKARSLADLAYKLDPRSERAAELWLEWQGLGLRNHASTVVVSQTATVASTSTSSSGPPVGASDRLRR